MSLGVFAWHILEELEDVSFLSNCISCEHHKLGLDLHCGNLFTTLTLNCTSFPVDLLVVQCLDFFFQLLQPSGNLAIR